ncbi:7347_t:CDS:2 [Funneliformis caledonium]|uniref:7347_t:CDS:1 n=1 Tax=Funneliformis caledonium TaxID=1117310 RepID=A0A9N8WCQ6_9GLOM|nr:7347_t:CDS:2 [Funneliformis caledonium]
MSSLTPSTESTAHESTLFEVSGKEPHYPTESNNLRWHLRELVLLVEWGLTEETANELRNSVCEDTLWSKQILYHWLYEWILNPWDSNIQMAFDNVFYDANFPRTQWNSYDRIGGSTNVRLII